MGKRRPKRPWVGLMCILLAPFVAFACEETAPSPGSFDLEAGQPGLVVREAGGSDPDNVVRDSRVSDGRDEDSALSDASNDASSDAAMCDGGRCPPVTCAAILASTDGGATSGIYTIDPDGPGGQGPFDVYCDMTTDDGG